MELRRLAFLPQFRFPCRSGRNESYLRGPFKAVTFTLEHLNIFIDLLQIDDPSGHSKPSEANLCRTLVRIVYISGTTIAKPTFPTPQEHQKAGQPPMVTATRLPFEMRTMRSLATTRCELRHCCEVVVFSALFHVLKLFWTIYQQSIQAYPSPID